MSAFNLNYNNKKRPKIIKMSSLLNVGPVNQVDC
jgi:hypothetical protein